MKDNLNTILLQIAADGQLQNTQKFEVVIAVIAIIFIGLVGYLIKVDRNLSKLEKK